MMTTQEKEQIYLEYRDKVMRYISTKVQQKEDVEDLCANVFVKVCDKADSYDREKAYLSTWIYTIARNTVIDYYRTRRSTETVPETLASEEDIDRNLINRETLEALATALQALPEDQSELIVLHYYKGWSLREISERMTLSYGVTKLRHRQAVRSLRESMARQGYHIA